MSTIEKLKEHIEMIEQDFHHKMAGEPPEVLEQAFPELENEIKAVQRIIRVFENPMA